MKNTISEKDFDKKFNFIHFLDSIRWQKCGNYYLINLAYPNEKPTEVLSDDEILLTHWLLYITDRQMSFRQIWDKGGLVISEVAHDFTTAPNNNDLISLYGHFRKSVDKGYEFYGKIPYDKLTDDQKKRLEPYYTNKELEKLTNAAMDTVFKSRFYTDDFLCMLYTLYTLSDQRFGRSLTEYLAFVIEKIYNNSKIAPNDKVKYSVLGMAYALYRLTYDISFTYGSQRITYKSEDKKENQINIDDFIKAEFKNSAQNHLNNIIKDIFCADDITLLNTLKQFFGIDEKGAKSKKKYESMKRTWCSLRDYLKSPFYKKLFTKCIRDHLNTSTVPKAFLDGLFCDKDNSFNACQWLELPGDVWNENSTFRRCITNKRNGKLGELLRKEFNLLTDQSPNHRNGYPEEFDTTFDFVPRMCEKNNCDVCPFGAINGGKIDTAKVDSLCVAQSGKCCPLVLLYCGYYHECKGNKDECTLVQIFKDCKKMGE